MIFAILPRNSFCSLHGTWTLLACCCSGLPFLGAKWIQAALLPFDASLSNLFAKDALHAQLNAYFVLHYCMAMWHTRLPFWAVFDVALKNMFPSTQLGSVGPWYQDSSLASDGLLSQELASGGRERKSRSLLHHATGRTWGEHSRVSLGWHGRLILFGCRWFAKKLRKLEIYPEYGFRFHRCKAIDSTENLRASHFEPWRKATHKDKDKAPWEDFGSEVLMVFALGQCSSDKHWAMFPVLTGGVKSWQDAMPTRSRNRSLKWAFSTSELGSSLIILSLWWLQVCNVIHFRIFHIAPVRAVQTRWTNSKQKKTHARLFCRLSPITPWCWQEGDDLVFEVVDYDKGAQQGDLMCSCVVPNKATARGDCTKGRKLYHAVW